MSMTTTQPITAKYELVITRLPECGDERNLYEVRIEASDDAANGLWTMPTIVNGHGNALTYAEVFGFRHSPSVHDVPRHETNIVRYPLIQK